ncbi:MAG: M48 family metalloprotease [Vicinamibacterales bacterium]
MSHLLTVTARRLVIVLLLAPCAITTAAAQSKSESDRIEAAAHYQRGVVFFQQGAYKEAEQAFRQAEKKDGKNIEYQLATADTYIKLHRPDDAIKRYSKIYKADPTHRRALAGMAAAYEEMQNYREATRMWMRYSKMPLGAEELAEATRRLHAAQELFAARYEIAENPAGGAANLATVEQEREWGLQFARQLDASGIQLVPDAGITAYVEALAASITPFAKMFPPQYALFVLDSPVVNAQTAPGFIFVYRGLLDTVTSEAELVGVLAHEMGHTIAHHGGKAVTKATQDQQTVDVLKKKDNKLGKVLAGILEIGNPVNQLSFSREQESQADRLGIHIAYDAGYDPRALAALFQKFESMEPSSRKAWDLMARTHPFSIDRMNAINDYVPLLPDRPLKQSSPAFEQMKARLRALPPPAPLQPRPAAPATAASNAPAAPTAPADPGGGGVIPFTIDNAPFAGEIPADWVARKTTAGTIIFEGKEGTEAFNATVELEIVPRSTIPDKRVEDVAEIVAVAIGQKQNARVEPPESRGGGQAYAIRASYVLQGGAGAVACRHISLVIDYPGHFVILSYFAPESLFDKYLPTYQQIGESFRYLGEPGVGG